MSSDTPNPSTDQENAKDKQQTREESILKDTFDPVNLAQKGVAIDPDEIGSNPAIAPETVTLNDPADIREGFKFDRD